MPAVTVVLNCLDGEAHIRQALDTVFAQTYTDWELVVVDDGSADASAEIARSYGERVRCLQLESTVPLGRARNIALRQARGAFVAFIDQDDLWLPSKLERQLPLFDDPEVGLVFSDAFVLYGRRAVRQVIGRDVLPRGRTAFRTFLADYRVVVSTVVLRSSMLASLPEWFDESMSQLEDADLFTRIAHDWAVDYVGEPLASWRMHWGSHSFARRDAIASDAERMLDKFRRLYPGFDAAYGAESLSIRDRITYETALTDWQRGDARTARQRLAVVCRRRPRYALSYAMSFAPYRVYETFNHWRWRLGW